MPLINLFAKIGLDGVGDVIGGLAQVQRGFSDTAGAAVQLGQNLAIAAAGATALVGAFAFDKAAQFDTIVRGLATVSNNADDLSAKLTRLREIAKLPGLSFKEAAEGVLRLQSAGLSANLAERALSSFGNLLAGMGKGKAELDGVTLALSQIANKGKLSAEEMQQLAERGVPTGRLLKDAFGTADTEAIQKMGLSAVQVLERLIQVAERAPKATGGIANDVENFTQRIEQVVLKLGQGIATAFQAAGPGIESLLTKVERVFTSVGEVLAAAGRSGVVADSLGKALGALGLGGDVRQAAASVTASIAAAVALAPRAIRETFTFISDGFGYLFNQLNVFLLRSVAAIQEQFVAPLQASLLNFSGAKATFQGARGINMVADALEATVKAPTSPFGSLMDDFNSLRGVYLQSTLQNIRPLSDLPEGLNFGGTIASASNRQKAELEKIEKNTRETADALTLRRQAFGGGELGNIGATALESVGSRSFYPGSSLVPAASELERLLRRIAREEASRAASGGRVITR